MIDNKNNQNKDREDKVNTYKVVSGNFIDMKNKPYKFGDTLELTDKEIKRYTELSIIGRTLKRVR